MAYLMFLTMLVFAGITGYSHSGGWGSALGVVVAFVGCLSMARRGYRLGIVHGMSFGTMVADGLSQMIEESMAEQAEEREDER